MLYLQENTSGLRSKVMDLDALAEKGPEVEEDEVDQILSKADGRILRKKDPQL